MPLMFLFLTVFVTGLAVTAIEMTASRFLAPFFGTSIFVWANVIGVVLASLAVGYHLGGKIADRHPRPRQLYFLILLTGILTDLIPLVGRPIMVSSYEFFIQRPAGIFWGSFFSVTILFVFPLIALGIVSPWIAKLAAQKIENIGRVVGNLYGFSTLGSLVGVFLPVLLTIPYIGTTRTFFLFGTMLVVLGAIGMVMAGDKNWPRSLVLIVISGLFFGTPNFVYRDSSVLAYTESLYNSIHVREESDGKRFMIINEGEGVQSMYNPHDFLTGGYWDAVSMIPMLQGRSDINALIIGVAGGTSLRAMHHFYPDISIDAVEIDPAIVELARQYFDLPEGDALKYIAQDGRTYVKQSDELYDFAFVDAYTRETAIPFHLATYEFFTELKARMNVDGIVAMNIAVFGDDTRIAEAIANTLSKVFQHTYQWWFPDTTSFLLFASETPVPVPQFSADSPDVRLDALLQDFFEKKHFVKHNPQKLVFYDDKSPIEVMTRLR